MRDACGGELKRSRCGLEGDGVPIVYQHAGIDGPEPAGQVIARTCGINRCGVLSVCVQRAVDGSLRTVTAIAAQSDVMKRGWLLLRQRVERKIGLALASVLLI